MEGKTKPKDQFESEDDYGGYNQKSKSKNSSTTIAIVVVAVLVATAFALVCYFGFRDTSADPPENSIGSPEPETDICQLPPEKGPCEAYMPRWGYDPVRKECIEFIYGGCEGNGNNFETRESCTEYCKDEDTDVCELPKEIGPCDGAMPRWYFDPSEERCMEFIYGGCEGNENNFLTEDDCESKCGDMGGLPPTCIQLQDSVYSMEDVTDLFGPSTLLNDVCPPVRTGNLREEAALPTGHFASNQINIGPSPIRLFPHSAIMDKRGIIYESYTLDRWTDPKRTDEFYQLTPGKTDMPWEKIPSVGAGMQQTNSGPDGTPLSTFSGLTGVRVGIENSSDAVMTDFDIMYATFMYHNEHGSLEVPLVRGAAMLTHIFTNANPVITPYCLTAINGVDASFECPEEETKADKGTAYVEVSCNSITGILSLVVHTTKPIPHVTDVQWAATVSTGWESARYMNTCDSNICTLSSDGMTVTLIIPDAKDTMNYAINIINMLVIPQSDYSYWYHPNPAVVACSPAPAVTISYSGRMPVWFYGTSTITTAHCLGNNISDAMVDVVLSLSSPASSLDEIDYIFVTDDEWTADHAWTPCSPDVCNIIDGGMNVVFTLIPTSEISYFAANVHGQFIIETEPWNWRRQPRKIQCPWVSETPQDISITDKSFIFELQEPGNLDLTNTRKFMAYFDKDMTVTVNDDGLFEFQPEDGGHFTGHMQLVYAGTSPMGDNSKAESLHKYAGVYSYKPKTRFCVEGDIGFISYDWNKQGDDFFGQNPNQDLLTVALPHHEEQLNSENLIETPWGFKGHIGDRWVLQEDLPKASIEPDQDAVERIKNDEDAVRLNHLLAAIEKDAMFETLVEDCTREGAQSYWAGKSIGMVTRLATISRAFGTDHYKKLDESLRTCLDLWLGIVGGLPIENVLRYDQVWGGMFMRSAGLEEEIYPWTNFGFVSYADHHFHFGYWMYAIAYYAKYYPQWAMKEENKVRITSLARDVGNPSKKDRFFPTVRQKDWFFGSSWATGIGGGARQEESASEAINCYHALGALGASMKDPVMEAFGRLMTATELRATRYYWTVRENNRHIFPEPLQTYGVLGQLQEDGIFYYTLNWECDPDQFPQRHACIVGIQLIPIMSISHWYMDQEWAKNVYDVCSWAIDPVSAPGGDMIDQTWDTTDPVTTRWGAFCQTIMSKKDTASQADAIAYTLALNTSDLEPGSGLASNLLFIYEST